MDDTRRELTALERNLRTIEYIAANRGNNSPREESPRTFRYNDDSYTGLRRTDMAMNVPESISFKFAEPTRNADLDETHQTGRYGDPIQDWVKETKNQSRFNRT